MIGGIGAVDRQGGTRDIKTVAKEVEAVFLRELLRQMSRSSLAPDKSEAAFGDGGRSTYREMFYETLADHIADSGGFGLAELLERSLKPPQKSGR